MPYDTHSRLSTLIMSAACFVAGPDDAARLLATANRFWSRGDDADRDAVLDCAQLLDEAIRLRLAGNIQRALHRERSAERILVLWDV
jgi:hypothetical protein